MKQVIEVSGALPSGNVVITCIPPHFCITFTLFATQTLNVFLGRLRNDTWWVDDQDKIKTNHVGLSTNVKYIPCPLDQHGWCICYCWPWICSYLAQDWCLIDTSVHFHLEAAVLCSCSLICAAVKDKGLPWGLFRHCIDKWAKVGKIYLTGLGDGNNQSHFPFSKRHCLCLSSEEVRGGEKKICLLW